MHADLYPSVGSNEKIAQADTARHDRFRGLLAAKTVGEETKDRRWSKNWSAVALHCDEALDHPLQFRQFGLLDPKFVVSLWCPPVHGLQLDTTHAHGYGPLHQFPH